MSSASHPYLRALAALALMLASACGAAAEPPVSNKVNMVITDKGFEPQNLRVKAGEPVVLTITRKTDVTCATEIVIDEYNIHEKLPLNTPVFYFVSAMRSTAIHAC